MLTMIWKNWIIESDNFMTMLSPIAEETPFGGALHSIGGRPATIEAEQRIKGKCLRTAISNKLHRRGCVRPCNQRVVVSDRHNRWLALEK